MNDKYSDDFQSILKFRKLSKIPKKSRFTEVKRYTFSLSSKLQITSIDTLETGGKPSTWFPLAELVELSDDEYLTEKIKRLLIFFIFSKSLKHQIFHILQIIFKETIRVCSEEIKSMISFAFLCF